MFKSDGMFSVRSFRFSLEGQPEVMSGEAGLLCKGVCPPKVQIFVCQLVRGRVLVKDLLYRFGMRSITDWDYSMCLKDNESIDHLFLYYDWAWKVWMDCYLLGMLTVAWLPI